LARARTERGTKSSRRGRGAAPAQPVTAGRARASAAPPKSPIGPVKPPPLPPPFAGPPPRPPVSRVKRAPKAPPADPALTPAITRFAPVEKTAFGPTVGDLRRSLQSSNATWSVHEGLRDGDPLPRHPMGGEPEGLTIADQLPRLDWTEVMSILPRNPLLLQQAIQVGVVPASAASSIPGGLPAARARDARPPSQRPRPSARRSRASK
jgi:hypothetical protein